jgi:hypothetical protein
MRGRPPNYFVVGAPKAGTTALAHFIGAHAEGYLPPRKEQRALAPDCYPDAPVVGDAEYVARFAAAPVSARAIGEASPMYLASRVAPERIRRINPDARIVAVLRDPVELVRSLHGQNVRGRSEPLLDLEAALAAETFRARGLPYPAHAPHTTHPFLHYRTVATYAPQLERYLALFPREQLLFLSYAQLRRDPDNTLRALLRFLDLAVPDHVAAEERNPSVEPRSATIARWLTSPPPALRAAGRALVPVAIRGELVNRAWHALLRPRRSGELEGEARARILAFFREDLEAVHHLTGLRIERDAGSSVPR